MKASTNQAIEGVNQSFRHLIEGMTSHAATVLAIVVLSGGLGSYFLVTSHATTPTKAVDVSSGTKTANATVVSDSTASGGTAVRFTTGSSGGGGGGTTNCTPVENIPSDFPNNCNTGYQNAPDYPGALGTCPTTIQSNHTYNFCQYSGLSVGSASSPVTNVIFHGCLFKANSVDNALVTVYGDNITFDYCTFQPNATFVPGTQVAHSSSYQYGIAANGGYNTFAKQMTVSHSDFWGFGNAIDTLGSTQAKPQVYSDNWIHDAANDGNADYHTDGIGSESGSGDGSYVVINHNTIVSPGNTNGIAFQQGSYSNFTITNNYFSGFGYTVALWAPAPNTTFTGNVWGTNLQQTYGPLYPQSFWTSSGSVWKNNKIHFVNQIYQEGDNKSGLITAADDGKYWTPNGISSTDF